MPNSAVRLALGLLLPVLLLLPGCFDFETHLELFPDGSGNITNALAFPAGMGVEMPTPFPERIVDPAPTQDAREDKGRKILSETTPFVSLDRLKLDGIKFEVEEKKGRILEMGKGEYRISWVLVPQGDAARTRRVLPLKEEMREPAETGVETEPQARARRMLDQSLAGHYVTVRLTLPGKVMTTLPVQVGEDKVEATVNPEGNIVEWKVPLGLLEYHQARRPLIASADFEGAVITLGPRNTMVSTVMTRKIKPAAPGSLENGPGGEEGEDEGTPEPEIVLPTPTPIPPGAKRW